MKHQARLVGLFVVISLLFFVTTSTFSAMKSRDSEMIKIAFMNGYVAAIQLDPDEIKKLQKDEAALRQAVEQAASNYLALCASMNK